jgi:hypothetical protein
MKKVGFMAVLAGLALLLAPIAHADTIYVGLGASPVTQFSGSGAGFVTGSGSSGIFSWSVNSQGSPLSPEPTLNSNTIDVTTTAATSGTLYLWVSEIGLTSPTGINNFVSSFTSNSLPASWTVVENTYVDTSNAVYGTGGGALASQTFTAIGAASSVNATPSLSSTGYSETEEFIITASAGPTGLTTNDTINMNVTPEPGTLAMFGSGLVALAGLMRRKLVRA